MTTFHLAGFPRVGAKRELKFAQERYWRGEIAEADLLDIAKRLRELNWQHQAKPRQMPILSRWLISHFTITF